MPIDFFCVLSKNLGGRLLRMKGLIKSLIALLFFSSAFFLGFYFGREKEKEKIPKFQDDLEGSI